MIEFHPIDYAAIIVYIAMTLAIGIFVKKRDDPDSFLIAGRNLNFFSSCMTISASKIGAGLLLTYSALVFAFGFSALWLFAGYVFGYLLFYFFAAKLKLESDKYGYYTLSDYFKHRFGKIAAYSISILVFLSMFGWIITNLIGGGKILALVSGFSFTPAVIIITIIIMIYLVIGGFQSVVKTDVIQYISILSIFILLLVIIASGNSVNSESLSHQSMKLGNILTFFITGLIFPFGSAELWQRVYATKTVSDLKKSLIAASALYFILGTVLSLLCLQIASNYAISSSEVALIEGAVHLLPSGFAGIFIIAFFAAIMSSADTFIFTSSSTLVQDYLQNIFCLTTKQVVFWSKVMMILLATVGAVVAVAIKSIVDTTFLFAALTLALGIISIGTWLRQKTKKQTIVLSAILAILAILVSTFLWGISLRILVVSLIASVVGYCLGELVFSIKRKTS